MALPVISGSGGMPEDPIDYAEGNEIDLENTYVAPTKPRYHRMRCENTNCKHHICLECHGDLLLRSENETESNHCHSPSEVAECKYDHDDHTSYKDVTTRAYFTASELKKTTENGQCSRCGLYFQTESYFKAMKKKKEEALNLV